MNIEQVKELVLTTQKEIIEFRKAVKERESKKILNGYLFDIESDLSEIENMEKTKTFNTAELSRMEKKYRKIYSSIKNKEYVIPIKNTPKEEHNLVKVEKVLPPEKQTEKQKEEVKKNKGVWKERLKGAIIAAAIIAVILVSKDVISTLKPRTTLDDDQNKESIEQLVDEENNALDENELNEIINDDDVLLEYAKELKDKYNIEKTPEEIVTMIKLANFDSIDENKDFTTREKVIAASRDLGNLLNKVPSNDLVVENENTDIFVDSEELNDILKNVTDNTISTKEFESIKTDKGYSIYRIYELCIKNLDNTDSKLAFNYAKILNDILARFTLDFTLCPDAPIDTYYTLFGMYNANKEKISKLTAGQNLSTIYGNGYQNDDTYGYICAEELMNYADFGNKNNIFYTAVIDDNIINQGITK